MKIGILGGGFDPPHIGHTLIAAQVHELLGIDQVWFVPCYQHPFNKPLSLPIHRLKMVEKLESSFIKTSSYEIQQATVSFAIDTLKGLSKRYPSHTFYWIVGTDQIPLFHKWKDWQEIIKKFGLIIFPRGEYSYTKRDIAKSFNLPALPENILVVHSKNLIVTNISSTHIRDRVKNNLPIAMLVHPDVKEYIKSRNLYTNGK